VRIIFDFASLQIYDIYSALRTPARYTFNILLILLVTAIGAKAQSYTIEGRVVDAETNTPLPFVNVVIEGEAKGTITDIDGKFTITSGTPFKALLISYIGYESARAVLEDASRSGIVIRLRRKRLELGEVEIMPGENPAHRIINKSVDNRKANDPERLRSFTYTSYNKMYITADLTAQDTINTLDTAKMVLRKMLAKQHLFMNESVTERKYLEGRNNEIVLANRMSGVKEFPFAFLSSQFQSFSFYSDMITVLDKKYLNPISPGSTSKYLFILEDTLYQGMDSVFVISFGPRKGRTFEALKGVLYINTNGYAIQNVLAEPVDNSGMVAGRIQQKYEFIDGRQWFPVQLNTDWYYNVFSISDSSISTDMRGRSGTFDPNNKLKIVNRTYLKDIVIDPPLRKKELSSVEMEIAADAHLKPEEFWNKYRIDSLTPRELMTYKVVDSIGKAENLDLKLRTYEALVFGKYPLGYFDIDLNTIYAYNEYEGNRLGFGMHTSMRLSKVFSAGGYGAYGLRDKDVKYGGDISFLLWDAPELKLRAGYMNDVLETGGQEFFDDRKLLSSESVRRYLITMMDRVEKQEISLSFRAMQHFRVGLLFNDQTRSPTTDYRYGIPSANTVLSDRFNITEAGLAIRIAYREKFLKTSRYKASLGSDHPVVYLQVTRGLKGVLRGEYEYARLDLKIESSFLLREYGRTTLQLRAGYLHGDLPYTLLYAGRGSYEKYSLAFFQSSFGTMRMNEFVSDKYAALFWMHNLGTLLSKGKKFRPELVLITNAGIGALSNRDRHFNILLRTMEKGYFESGLLVNSIFRSELFGAGIGALYRYGPYSFSKPEDNMAVKLTMSVNF
jgi:hypothetical protein